MRPKIFFNVWSILGFLLLFAPGCDTPFDSGQNDGEVKVVWSYPRGDLFLPFVLPEKINPIIADGKVFAAVDTSLVCSELQSGQEVWRVGLRNDLPDGVLLISSRKLLHYGERVFFNAGGLVKAFDKRTGEVAWETEAENFRVAVPNGMSQNSTHLFLNAVGQVIRLEKETGAVDRRFVLDALVPDSVDQRAGLTAVSEDGLLYIPTSYGGVSVLAKYGNLFCYNAQTGENVWGWQIPNRKAWSSVLQDSSEISAGAQNCAISDQFVATLGGQSVWLLDRFTGEPVWERFFPNDSFISLGVTIAEGKVFVGSNRGFFYAIDVATGDVVWTVYIFWINDNLFTYDNGRLYFCNENILSGGAIWVLDAATGGVVWSGLPPESQSDPNSRFSSTVAVGEGHMINIGTKKVYCLTVP